MRPPNPPSATDRHAPPPRQRRSFAISVAIALALNAVVLTAVAVAVQAWEVHAPAPRQVSWVTTVSAARTLAERVPAETRLPPSIVDAERPVEKLPQQALTLPAASPKTPPAPSGGGTEVRFYKYREVDRIAEPDSDWNLDAGVLDGAGIQTLVFEIFVSASGEVVACTVLEPSELMRATRSLVEDRLRSTVVRPAIRAGVPVASVRRIEVSVESSGQ